MKSSGKRSLLFPAFWPSLGLIAAAVALAVGVGAFNPHRTASDLSVRGEVMASVLVSDADPFELYSARMNPYKTAPAPEFGIEVYPLDDARQIYSQQGNLVALQFDEEPSACSQRIGKQLEQRGWQVVSSGSATHFTAVKETGRYCWTYVDITGNDAGSMAVFTLVDQGGNHDG